MYGCVCKRVVVWSYMFLITCMVLTCDFFYLYGISTGTNDNIRPGPHLEDATSIPHTGHSVQSHIGNRNLKCSKGLSVNRPQHKRSAHSMSHSTTESRHLPHYSIKPARDQTVKSDDTFNQLLSSNTSYYSEWFKESIDGLSCDHDRQLCDNEDECAHLSYLWHMAQLYSSFHSRGVQQIKDGWLDSVRTLTWYCGSTNDCGGLGYQFQGMTVTWVLGMLTGRVMLLKWKDESVVSKYLLPHMVDWRYQYKLKGSFVDLGNFAQYIRNDKSKNRSAARITVYYHNMMKALTGSVPHVQMHFNLLTYLNQIIFNLSPSNHFKLPCGHIPGIKLPSYYKFHEVLTEFVAIHTLFKLSDQLKSHLYNVQSQITSTTNGGQYVAVHLRTGSFDDLYEPKIQKRTAHKEDWSKAINCAVKQANKHIGPASLILLVSDSKEAKNLLSKEYPRIRIFENKIVHVDMHSNVTEDGMLGVWQDIAILAQSNVLIKHVSTFSDLAALMCGIPRNRIVDFAKC